MIFRSEKDKIKIKKKEPVLYSLLCLLYDSGVLREDGVISYELRLMTRVIVIKYDKGTSGELQISYFGIRLNGMHSRTILLPKNEALLLYGQYANSFITYVRPLLEEFYIYIDEIKGAI